MVIVFCQEKIFLLAYHYKCSFPSFLFHLLFALLFLPALLLAFHLCPCTRVLDTFSSTWYILSYPLLHSSVITVMFTLHTIICQLFNHQSEIILCSRSLHCVKTFYNAHLKSDSNDPRIMCISCKTKSVKLHVGNILNQKSQYIAMAYFDNQHL